MESDKIVVSRILNGDGQAFEMLLLRYSPRIHSFICKMGLEHEDAKDITQDVFIKAYRNLNQYRDQWQFSTWLFTIAVNLVKDLKKTRKFVVQYPEYPLIATMDYLPEEHLDHLARRDFIREMFKTLDEPTRTMLLLYYFADLPIKEIGQICNEKAEVVKMKIHRARHKLCDQFGEKWGGEHHAL